MCGISTCKLAADMTAWRVGLLLVGLILAQGWVFAQTTDIQVLAAHLKAVRGYNWKSDYRRQFQQIRNDMLEWIDTRIHRGESAEQLNQHLRLNSLQTRHSPYDDKWSGVVGYVDEVRFQSVESAADLYLVHFGIGMACEYDETIVVYRREPLARIGWIGSSSFGQGPAKRFDSVSIGDEIQGKKLLAAGSHTAWCSSTVGGIQLQAATITGASMRTLLNRDTQGRVYDIAATVDGNSVTFRYIDLYDKRFTERYEAKGEKFIRVAKLTP
jgi:hypothetical protein